MPLSCIISEIKRDIVENRDFFLPHLHSTHPVDPPNIAITFGTEYQERWVYQNTKRSLVVCLAVSIAYNTGV